VTAVNLHQFNITGNHISYNRLGGIRIERSEVRNLQITGNDIEVQQLQDVCRRRVRADGCDPLKFTLDCRETAEGVPSPSVREFTIASNTIQATHSPNGCNIRIIGPDPTGVFGDRDGGDQRQPHWESGDQPAPDGLPGIAITGNHIYGGYRHNVRMEGCDDMTLGSNIFGHNYWVPGKQIDNNIYLEDCSDCVLTGLQVRGAPEGKTTWTEDWAGGAPRVHEALIELIRCRRLTIDGCQLRDPAAVAVLAKDCSSVSLTGCQIHDSRETPLLQTAVSWEGAGTGDLMASNLLGSAGQGGSGLSGGREARLSLRQTS